MLIFKNYSLDNSVQAPDSHYCLRKFTILSPIYQHQNTTAYGATAISTTEEIPLQTNKFMPDSYYLQIFLAQGRRNSNLLLCLTLAASHLQHQGISIHCDPHHRHSSLQSSDNDTWLCTKERVNSQRDVQVGKWPQICIISCPNRCFVAVTLPEFMIPLAPKCLCPSLIKPWAPPAVFVCSHHQKHMGISKIWSQNNGPTKFSLTQGKPALQHQALRLSVTHKLVLHCFFPPIQTKFQFAFLTSY